MITDFKMLAHPIRKLPVKMREAYLKALSKTILKNSETDFNERIMAVMINTLELDEKLIEKCKRYVEKPKKAEKEAVKEVLMDERIRVPFLIDSFLIGYLNNGLTTEEENIIEIFFKLFKHSEIFYELGKSLLDVGENRLDRMLEE